MVSLAQVLQSEKLIHQISEDFAKIAQEPASKNIDMLFEVYEKVLIK